MLKNRCKLSVKFVLNKTGQNQGWIMKYYIKVFLKIDPKNIVSLVKFIKGKKEQTKKGQNKVR